MRPATEIGKVRVRSPDAGLLDRHRLVSALIERADMVPPRLPAGAILIVRRLSATMRSRALAPLVPTADLWTTAPRDQMADLLDRAVRPVDGALPADAVAVLFADESELLACMVRDMLHGTLARWWWWKAVGRPARSLDPADAMRISITAVPGAISLLDDWREADALVGSLSDHQAETLLEALASAFSLAVPRHAAGSPEPRVEEEAEGADVAAASPAGAVSVGSSRAPAARGLWQRALGDSAPVAWSGPKAVFLATALLVHRNPAAARIPTHLAALADPHIVVPAASAAELSWSPSLPRSGPTSSERASAEPDPSPFSSLLAGEDRPPQRDAVETSVDAEVEVDPVAAPSTPPDPVPLDSPRSHPQSVVIGADGHDIQAAAGSADAGTPTDLGGLFFLVNVIVGLDLIDAFADWGLDEMSAWEVVDALARSLISEPSVATDPVWDVLAELAGRATSDELGTPVPEDATYRMPSAWSAVPLGIPQWAWRAGRLRVWTDAGYVLAEVPAVEARTEHVLGLVSDYVSGTVRCRRRAFASAPVAILPAWADQASPAFRRWLELFVPYLQARLSDALGEQPAAVGRVLMRPAVLNVSRTHIDVVMDLDSVSVPVRMAGLDLDPGWVPSLGRVITFTYQ